jgi:hypothetical protein
MRKILTTFLALVLISCSSADTEEATVVEDTTTSTTTTSTTTSTTTTLPVDEPWAVDEYGIELIEMGPEMKAQFDELISFVEKRVGLEFTEYPNSQLYTVNGYQEYNAVSYLDDFDEDYEEGEWERAVLSENMWGLTTATPEQMKNLLTEFQRCASSGSYNLLDKILRIPVKANQKKFNLWEQSVIVHELVHSLQGQVVDLSGWYLTMKEADDFSDYPGRRAIMEAQADLIQARWEGGLDNYDRTAMNSQQPNISCAVSLPSYFYIPFDLYYSFGPQLVKEINSNGGMDAINAALFELPTDEQIYSSEKYFSGEVYEEVSLKEISINNFSLIDEGDIGSLDMVYILQDFIGRVESVKAAIGIGGGAWKDYVDDEGNLVMTLKVSGDTAQDLFEIYDAYLLWTKNQGRFADAESFANGQLFAGDTNFWMYNDGTFIRMVLTQDRSILDEISDQITDF